MIQKADDPDVLSYSGELRRDGDWREAQVLFEYDKVFNVLKEKGLECELDLPPLFLKDYIDHGSLTLHNKNTDYIRVNMNIVLQYLESSGMYDLL